VSCKKHFGKLQPKSQRGEMSCEKGVIMTRSKACILVTVLTFTSIVTASFSALAQEKARIGWTGINPAASPIWVVQEKGFLKKLGVNAEIINISSSPIAMQALLAGELDVIVSSVTTLVTSRLAGADAVMVQTLVPTFVDHIVSLASITDVQQLKGKTGGVNRAGSTSDLGLRLALRRFGINPEKDMNIVTAGDAPARLAAMSRGFLQFTIIPEPFVQEAEKLGFRDLLDSGTLGIPFHWNAVLTRETVVKSRRGMVAKVVQANTEAIHFIKTNREESKAIFSKYLNLKDATGLERAVRAYANIFPEVPTPSPEGVKTMLDDLAPRNPKAQNADATQYVDLSFVRELESSGFIKRLYGK
jgi:NitT/TauT family transport system substrate-binding protein